MRILTALTYYRPHYSGLTIYTERVARALAERGHQVTVLTSRFDKSLPRREQLDGIRIIRPDVWFHVSKGVIMPGMPFWAWRLARQADIVHVHVPQLDAAPIALVSRMLGKPVVLTYHCDLQLPEGFVHRLANRVSDIANHITARMANVIVQNTRDYAQHSAFLRRYLSKMQPIYPPVEVCSINAADRAAFRAKYRLHPNQRLIGMAARLATEKGVEYLAQALPMVLQRFPDAHVLFVGPYQNVVGEADYAQRLLAMIEPLREHWSFLGILSPQEMATFFHECEVTILPSINSTESYGIVQVESMLCGTPVVASDLPGVRVPVQETGMGKIVPPADAHSLAQAIVAILEKPQDFRGHPEPLLRASAPEAVASEYEKIFQTLTARQFHSVTPVEKNRARMKKIH